MANIRIDGVSEVIQFCALVGDTAGPQILRPILERGAEVFAAAVREEAPKDTGALGQSVQAVLARNAGVARAYTTFDVDQAISQRNAKRSGSGRSPVENRDRYPFIVIAGTHPHVIRARRGGVLLLAGGQFASEVQHGGSDPNPFVDRAFRSARAAVAEQVTGEIAQEFLKLKARYNA